MGQSGYIDWHAIARFPQMQATPGQSWVYAFWLVDYGRNDTDHGVTLLKDEDRHPDWFLHAERADSVLTAHIQPSTSVDTIGWNQVFNSPHTSRPLLASILLGTSDCAYRDAAGAYWSCTPQNLTWRGKRLVKEMTQLYLRPPVLVTFLDVASDEEGASGVGAGTATATPAPGH